MAGRTPAILAAALLAGRLAAFGDGGGGPIPTSWPEPDRAGGFDRSFASVLESGGRVPDRFPLDLRFADPPDPRPPFALPLEAPAPSVGVGWIAAASLGTVAGAARNSFRTPRVHFHFTDEGFFGQNTYAGGADKASHLVSFFGVARMMTLIDEEAGMRPRSAEWLGAGVAELAGLVIELGDGTTHYGFSYEDLVFDTLGAGSELVLSRFGLLDLIGMRFGWVSAPETPCCRGIGTDYSKVIYTIDLKLAGLADRARVRIGPARFLLLSVTYGSKGYSYWPPAVRERQVGLEVGLDAAEVLRALALPEDRWWSRPIYYIANLVRIPYSAIGFRYDLNHSRWSGPDTGSTFHPPVPPRSSAPGGRR